MFLDLVVSVCRICRLISSDWLYHILDKLSHKLGICFADIADAVYRSCCKILSLVLAIDISAILIAELSSGPKGRTEEPHNYRARIEIEKTMRLCFHGHRG